MLRTPTKFPNYRSKISKPNSPYTLSPGKSFETPSSKSYCIHTTIKTDLASDGDIKTRLAFAENEEIFNNNFEKIKEPEDYASKKKTTSLNITVRPDDFKKKYKRKYSICSKTPNTPKTKPRISAKELRQVSGIEEGKFNHNHLIPASWGQSLVYVGSWATNMRELVLDGIIKWIMVSSGISVDYCKISVRLEGFTGHVPNIVRRTAVFYHGNREILQIKSLLNARSKNKFPSGYSKYIKRKISDIIY